MLCVVDHVLCCLTTQKRAAYISTRNQPHKPRHRRVEVSLRVDASFCASYGRRRLVLALVVVSLETIDREENVTY